MREKQRYMVLSHSSLDVVERKAWSEGQAGYVIMMKINKDKTDIHGSHCERDIDVRKAWGEG